jgi:predicted GNAT family acetyltransferase
MPYPKEEESIDWYFVPSDGIIAGHNRERHMAEIRILQPGDEAAMEAFLLPRVESSMFLIGNMRAAGLVDDGKAFKGTYAAVFAQEQIVGVVAHYWNGNLILQAPTAVDALCQAAVRASGRRINGLIGPQDQVGAAREALGLEEAAIQMDETEKLYSLALEKLAVPKALRSGRWRGRRIQAGDLDLLTEWRVGFSVEALGEEPSPRLCKQCRASAERSLEQGVTWLLEDGGEPVATSSFNATIDEAVQVGGVWTPPHLRNRGYGRAAVAASLLDARAEGVTTSILFTGEGNLAAQRAYEALGFRQIGHYRLLLLHSPASGRA